MALLRKAGSLLGRSVSNHFSRDDITLWKPSIFQAVRWMSSSKVFVGGISYSTDDSSLREAFSRYGQVAEARVIVDRESGKSRGFGFVTFTSGEEASAAIQAMDQQELHGRQIRVNYANDRARGYGGGGDYGRGSGGYGGDGGNYGGGGGSYGGSYGGGGGGYGGNYNSGGDGGGSYNSGGYGGGSNYHSSVGSYASGGGTNDGFDSRTSAASSGGNSYFGGGGGGSGGYDECGDGSDKGNNNGVGDGEDFGMDEGASFGDRDDDMDNYVNKRS